MVASGPMFQFAKRDGNKIILSFSDTGSGLIAKGGDRLKHFAVSGADQNFVWADARIEGDCIVVWNDKVPDPVHVRYAWDDNPEDANLYNREGLPAAPFTTE